MQVSPTTERKLPEVHLAEGKTTIKPSKEIKSKESIEPKKVEAPKTKKQLIKEQKAAKSKSTIEQPPPLKVEKVVAKKIEEVPISIQSTGKKGKGKKNSEPLKSKLKSPIPVAPVPKEVRTPVLSPPISQPATPINDPVAIRTPPEHPILPRPPIYAHPSLPDSNVMLRNVIPYPFNFSSPRPPPGVPMLPMQSIRPPELSHFNAVNPAISWPVPIPIGMNDSQNPAVLSANKIRPTPIQRPTKRSNESEELDEYSFLGCSALGGEILPKNEQVQNNRRFEDMNHGTGPVDVVSALFSKTHIGKSVEPVSGMMWNGKNTSFLGYPSVNDANLMDYAESHFPKEHQWPMDH